MTIILCRTRTSVRTYFVVQGNYRSYLSMIDISFSSSGLSMVMTGTTSVVGRMSPTVLHDIVVVESVTTTMVAEA